MMRRQTIGEVSYARGGSKCINVAVPTAVYDEVGRMATRDGESMSAVMRRAITQLLAGEMTGATPKRRLTLAHILLDELHAILDQELFHAVSRETAMFHDEKPQVTGSDVAAKSPTNPSCDSTGARETINA